MPDQIVSTTRRKTAVVTGAGGTLGAHLVRKLLESGATVLAIDSSSTALDALSATFSDDAERFRTVVADVSVEEDVVRVANAAAEIGAGIDLLVNGAGVEGRISLIESAEVPDWERVFAINVVGTMQMMKHLAKLMVGGSSIVNLGSTGSHAGSAGAGAYVASKHAVLGLTRTAAIEFAGRGIRVNCACPGPINGPMMDSLNRQRSEALPSELWQASDTNYSDPSDVAAAILALGSDSMLGVTGEFLIIDSAK